MNVLLLKGTLDDDAADVDEARRPDGFDQFESALRATGRMAQCWTCPILQARCINSYALKEEIQLGSYGAIAVTSKRAAWALHEATHDSGAANVLATVPVVAVGSGTEAACRAAGAPIVQTVPGGRGAGDLADYIAAHHVSSFGGRPVLFLVGDKRLDVLPNRLHRAGIPLKELLVYETAPRSDLHALIPDQLSRLLHGSPAGSPAGSPPAAWIVFFSPSGVQAVADLIRLDVARHHPSNRLHLAAIGQTTASAMRSAGLPVDAVAGTPQPAALAEAVLTCSAFAVYGFRGHQSV